MKHPALLLILLAIALNSSIAQGDPIWKFARTSNTAEIKLMESDSLGNTYIAGTFTSDVFTFGSFTAPGITGNENTFLLKINPAGQFVWLESAYGEDPGAEVKPTKISISERGELAVLLSTIKTSSITIAGKPVDIPDSTQKLPLLFKFSKSGRRGRVNILSCINPGKPVIEALDLIIDEEGFVYSTGFFIGERASINNDSETFTVPGINIEERLFITSIRPDGGIEWFNTCEPDGTGDDGHIRGMILGRSGDGSIYLAGTTSGYRVFEFGPDKIENPSQTDAFLAKYYRDGSSVRAVQIKGEITERPDDIVLLDNEEIVLMGFSNSPAINFPDSGYSNVSTDFNLFLARYSPETDFIRSTSINTQLPSLDSEGDNAFINSDAYGDIVICSEFFSPEVFADGPILENTSTDSTSDILVAKILANTFEPTWARQGKGPGNNSIEGVSIDRKGNVYLGGTTINDFSPPTVDDPIPYNTDGTPYLVKISSDGIFEYKYLKSNSGESFVRIDKISSDASGNSYVGGSYSGASSAVGTIDLTESGNLGLFFGKFAFTKNIIGRVENTVGDAITEGYVKIYGYSQYQRSPLNDSVPIGDEGNFEFNNIPLGNYLLVAIPTGSTSEEYIPTYFPSEEYWDIADRLRIGANYNQEPITITILRRTQFTGTAEASGNVSEEDELNSVENFKWNKYKPSKRTKIVLAGNKTKSTYEIVATVYTDTEGNFAFSGINDGLYFIWVDIPGLPCEPIHFIQIVDGMAVGNIDYLINEETIEPVGTPQSIDIPEVDDSDQGFTIYPNPATDEMTIAIEDFGQGIADIYTINGKHLKHVILLKEETSIDLTELSAGTYLMRIMTNEILGFKKITIIR